MAINEITDVESLQEIFQNHALTILGHTTAAHRRLKISGSGSSSQSPIIDADIAELKSIWKDGLAAWY